MKTIEQVREEIISFLELGKPQKVAIVADNDEDGFSSALQVKKVLDSNGHKSRVFFYEHYAKSHAGFVEEFVSFAPQKTFFLDLADDLVSGALELIGKKTGPFVIIDHHKKRMLRNNISDFLVVRPADFSDIDPVRYPVAKMVFDIFPGNDWMCAVGIIGDYAADRWQGFLEAVKKKYSVSFDELKQVGDLIPVVVSLHPEKKLELFEDFYSAKSPKDLFNSTIFELKKELDEKLAQLEKEFPEKAERFPELDLVFFQARDRLVGKIINIFSTKSKNTTFVVYEEVDSRYKVSLRRGDFKVDCAELARYAITNAKNAGGGGHIPAAGADFPKEYLKEFKERIKEYLVKNYVK